MLSDNECIVYILTNDAMPGFVKVGTTRNTMEQRLRQLYTSGVPVPFECYYAGVVEQALNVEKRIHRAFAVFRVNQNREFFEIDAEAAADIVRMVAIRDATPGEDFVEVQEDKIAMERLEKRAERFNFSMVGIQPNAELLFSEDNSITCRVIDNRRVDFNGEEMSLSAAALRALKSKGFDWKSAQGARWWTWNGQTLLELRKSIESD